MGIDRWVRIAVVLGLLAVGTGQLPRVIFEIWKADLRILHESRALAWGQPLLLPVSKQNIRPSDDVSGLRE